MLPERAREIADRLDRADRALYGAWQLMRGLGQEPDAPDIAVVVQAQLTARMLVSQYQDIAESLTEEEDNGDAPVCNCSGSGTDVDAHLAILTSSGRR